MFPVHSAPTVPAGAGRRACPPEDCGGTWGYRELCKILTDPARPEHDERPELIGRPFDDGAWRQTGSERADRDDGDAIGADVAEDCPGDDSEN